MASSVSVIVQGLDGNQLELAMQTSETVENLRERISTEWGLDSHGFRLFAGASLLKDTTEIKEVDLSDVVQLVKFDPLPNLGLFDQSHHEGIEVRMPSSIEVGPFDGKCTTLLKTSNSPDSNNVFLRHAIRTPCFAEFKVVRSRDELSFGVTYDAEMVEKVDGFGNLRLTNTWVFSKRKSMPVLFFGGKQDNPPGDVGFAEGDRVAVYADPENRLVKFYRNGILAASNDDGSLLPEQSERPLRMYAMVDAARDEISVLRFGPGKPYV
jgi:hypothetical protein